MLLFRLSAPARIQFIVLGSAPECRRLGMFSRPGRAGLNRIRFLGRLHGRPLPPGTYTLVPTVVRKGQRIPLGRITIMIVSSKRKLSAAEAQRPVKAECLPTASDPIAGAGAPAGDTSVSSGSSGTGTGTGASTGQADGASASPAPATPAAVAGVAETKDPVAEDLGVLADVPLLADIIPDDPPVPPLLLAVLALVAIGVGSLVLIALVLRYFRGTWVP